MKNVKTELENKLKELGKTIEDISWVKIYHEVDFDPMKCLLDSDNLEEIKDNWDNLDTLYDNNYGHQELYGVVFFKDQTWLERYEYDGSEWWVYKKLPVYVKGAFEYDCR